MDAIAERFISLSGVTLHARESGEGPAIILMHGITANAAVWDPVITGLSDIGRAISVSQRGHGLSDKPEPTAEAYRARAYAGDIVALIESLGGEPVILVGHSLGARNALSVGALRPDLVRAVVAVDFTPYIETAVFDTLSARVEGGDQTFDTAANVESYLQDRYPLMPKDAVVRRAQHGYVQTEKGLVPRASAEALTATVEGLRDSLEKTVQALQVPTVFVRGLESKLVTPEAFEKTTRLRPDLDYTEVPGTDHYVPEENPGAVAAITRLMAHRS